MTGGRDSDNPGGDAPAATICAITRPAAGQAAVKTDTYCGKRQTLQAFDFCCCIIRCDRRNFAARPKFDILRSNVMNELGFDVTEALDWFPAGAAGPYRLVSVPEEKAKEWAEAMGVALRRCYITDTLQPGKAQTEFAVTICLE